MNNKKKSGVLLFTIVVFISLVSRLIYIFFLDYSLKGHNSVFNAIFNNEDLDLTLISPTSIYILLVNLSSLIIGSKEYACLLINALLQMLSIIVLFFAFKNIVSIYSSFAAVMIFSLWPWFNKKIFDVSSFNLIHLFRSLIILLLSLLYILIQYRINKKSNNIIKDGVKDMMKVTSVSENINNDTPAGMKEITNQINYIENPLPVPKRREHKAMEYMIETTSENDFFDIEDMTGMDFFDIE